MSIDTTTAANTAANTAAPTALTSELRQAALDHLWQHNRDWESAARDNEPLIFVSGEGIRVTDSDGETWIDVNGGYGYYIEQIDGSTRHGAAVDASDGLLLFNAEHRASG